jgi:hypothetical protein
MFQPLPLDLQSLSMICFIFRMGNPPSLQSAEVGRLGTHLVAEKEATPNGAIVGLPVGLGGASWPPRGPSAQDMVLQPSEVGMYQTQGVRLHRGAADELPMFCTEE